MSEIMDAETLRAIIVDQDKEIEWLRSALEELANSEDFGNTCNWARNRAREALK